MKRVFLAAVAASVLSAFAAPADFSAEKPKYPDELGYTPSIDHYLGRDVDLSLLNDHTERKGVGWNNDGRPRSFICSLETTANLRFVEVTAPRGTRSTLLDEIRVSVDDGSGAFGPETVIDAYGKFDHYPRPGEPKINEDCTNHIYRVDVGGPAARVKVWCKGSAWMSLGEIRLCGSSIAEAEKMPAVEAGVPRKMSGRNWRIEVDPLGARVIKARSSLHNLEFTDAEGAFTEDCWNVRKSAWHFLNRPFAIVPSANSVNAVGAAPPATDSGIGFLEIDKEYGIDNASSALSVRYRFVNQPAAMSDQSFSPRVRLRFGVKGKKTTYVVPTQRGVLEVTDDGSRADFLVPDPVRGWIAAKDDEGRGFLMRMDEAEVRSLRLVFPKDGGLARLEWFIPSVLVKCGGYHETKAEILPFRKLDDVITAADREPVRAKPRRSDPISSFDFCCFTNFPKRLERGWAKPLAAKRRLKALMLTTEGSMIEIGKIAERFDVDYKTMWFDYDGSPKRKLSTTRMGIGDYFNLHPPTELKRNLDLLLKDDYDVIALGGIALEAFPDDVRKRLHEMISAGTGLVTVGQDRGDEMFGFKLGKERALGVPVRKTDLFASVPFEVFPRDFVQRFEPTGTVHAECAGTPYVMESKIGKGRHIALLYHAVGGSNVRYSPRGGFTPWLDDFYEDRISPAEEFYMLVAKSMLYAAGRESPCKLSKVSLSPSEAKFSLNLPRDGKTVWEWRVFDPFGSVLASGAFKKPLKAGVNEVSLEKFAPPAFAGGQRLRLTVWTSSGKALDFGEWVFKNDPQAVIKSFKAEKKEYVEYDSVGYAAEIAGDATGLRTEIRLIDHWGRTVAVKSGEPSGKIRIENALPSRCYELRASLFAADGREVSRRRVRLIVRPDMKKDPWVDFEPGAWISNTLRPYLWPEIVEVYQDEMRYKICLANHQEMQDDMAPRYGYSPCILSGCGLWRSPEPPEYLKTGDKMVLKRTPCLSDPEKQERFRKNGDSAGKKAFRSGARFIWFGDENSLTGYNGQPIDFCFSDHCLKAFRPWLKGRYGSLDRLNCEWNTSFKTWDEVLPFTRQEIWAEGGMKHVAGWADHLEFMDGTYTNAMRIAFERVRAVDPEVRMAHSGTQEPSAYGALDWWKQLQMMDGLLSYTTHDMVELHRSFMRPERGFIAPWTWGYSRRGPFAVREVWWTAFIGARGIMGFINHTMVNCDWTLSSGARDTYDSIHRLTDGTGLHLINNLVTDRDVAILYSQASVRAAFIEKRREDCLALREKWIAVMRALGVAFDFVSYDQLMDGTFLSRPYKVLVLADACALDDREIAAVEAFRRRRGKVLAEGVPGRLNWNCTPRNGGSPLKVDELEPQISLAYRKAVNTPTAPSCAAEIERVQVKTEKFLASAGVATDRLLRIENVEDGKPYRHATIFVKRDCAGNPFYGVLGEETTPKRVRFSFPKKSHVYNLVNGRYLGFTDRAELPFGMGIPYAFQLMDRKVEIASCDAKGNEVLVCLSDAVDGAVQLRVYRPDGREARSYRANVLVKGGRARHAVPFALSDPKGGWKITVESIFGGRREILMQR